MDYKAILRMALDEEGMKQLVLGELMDKIVKAKLDELVQDSSNTLDDALLEMIYPLLKSEVEKHLDKLFAMMDEQPSA